MKLEVGKKYETDHPRVAWVKIVSYDVLSEDDCPYQPFRGIENRGFECFFNSKGECLGPTDTPIFTLTKEYAE